ncbi:hypothetical protein PXH69_28810 [Rhodococcus qingshengii]|uniref:Uncharacterized protein n=1 Tax=Rhodococcus qingshengii TaxID=334542 RepID=A0AAW6LPL8_RHOSG|nr:hypothetical protein [Rhodococcus qingshengii]MDE8648979.1 hypothetical protein [Rhodococcus qingshengii]
MGHDMTKELYTGLTVAAMVFAAGIVLTGFALNAWTVVAGIVAICAGFIAWIYVRGDVERTDRSGEFRLSKEQRKTVKRLDAKRKFQAAIPPEQRKMNRTPRFSENFGPIQGEDGEWYFPKSPIRPGDPGPPETRE